jgi:hypothetical protein
MLNHFIPHPTAMPPPRNAAAADERYRPRNERVPLAATVVATIIVAALAIVLALTLIATMPAGIAAPVAILFIGGLVAGSLAMRTRAGLVRRAHGAGRRQPLQRRSREEVYG